MDGTVQTICNLSNAVLLVAQTDVVSLWSAGRVQASTGRSGTRSPANGAQPLQEDSRFTDEDVEKATTARCCGRCPTTSRSSDRPSTRAARGPSRGITNSAAPIKVLAAELAGATTSAEGTSRCSTSTTKATARERTPGHLVVLAHARWTVDPVRRVNLGNTFSPWPLFAGLLASAISPSLLEHKIRQ